MASVASLPPSGKLRPSVAAATPRKRRRRLTSEERAERADEALARARGSLSVANFPAVYAGFIAKGIPEAEISPRENILTYAAWRAVGRQVRRGEHGVRIQTWIDVPDKTDEETGEIKKGGRAPKLASVFHISQTDPVA